MAEFKPFKVVRHEMRCFDEYWFHCTECGAEYYRHNFDSRTRTICFKCSKEREKIKAKERAERKEKAIRAMAIQEFAEVLKASIEMELANPDLILDCKKCGIWKAEEIDEIAEQLKGE